MKKIITLCAASLLSLSAVSQMRITEWMYDGVNAEFVEFTNVGNTAINMTNWSFDDNSRVPGSQSLSGFGIVQPGESVVFAEASASIFRSAWGLCAGIKIIGGNANNLGRADEINLYDGSSVLVDRLTYDDQGVGTVKGPRTQNKSGWVPLGALGANTAAQWTLSAVSDVEGSFTSVGGEIGSPGKSARATVGFTPCPAPNGAPTIVMDVATTSNFLDAGVLTSPSSAYGISGVIGDPTDPMRTLGITFTISDPNDPVGSLTVTASSSNTLVVPSASVNLTGSNGSRTVKIMPLNVGYSNITVTVSDGTLSTSYVLNYGASAASATPGKTLWHTGISDGSAAMAIDDNYYIGADDELNLLNVYSRSASGLPAKSYDYTSNLNLPDPSKPEVDVEAVTRSYATPGKMYWLGSMSNGKGPNFDDKPNRNRLFATTVSGTGSLTAFTFSGYYGNLRARLIAWGDANGYNFTAGAAAGVDSKAINGLAAEGMVFGPDNTTLYLGLRAPLVPTANRTKAVIAPILNFESWFNNGAPVGNPTFGSPIELNLGNRGIRDLIRLTNGTYIIIAGNYSGSPVIGAIYKWSGNAADQPVLVNSPASTSLAMEGAMQVNVASQLSLSKLQVISDGGDDDLYNDGSAAKDLGDLNLRKFRSDSLQALDLTLCLLTATVSASGSTTFCSGGSVTLTANAGMASYLWSNGAITPSIIVSAAGNYSVAITDTNGCPASSSLTSVTVNALPVATITASGSTTLCAGGAITLSATPGMSTYLWSNGATTPTISASTSGNYSVVVTGTNGCSAPSAPVTVGVNALPVATITAGGDLNFCAGGSVMLTATPGMSTYLWSNSANSPAINALASGNYSVTVTNAGGCSAVASISVQAHNNVSAPGSIGSDQSHCGPFQPSQLTSIANASADPGETVYYQWLKSNVDVINTYGNPYWQAIPGATLAAYQPDSIFQDKFYIRCSRTQFCTFVGYTTESNIVDAYVNPIPTATITASGNTTLCAGGSVTLSATPGMSVYLWSNGAITPSISVSASGNYSVSLTSSAACTATSGVTNVSVNNVINSNISYTACNTYVWNAITYTASGIYTYSTQTASGCDSTANLNLTIRNSSASTETQTACNSYLWNATTYTASGIYTYTTQNAAGCDSIAQLHLTIRNSSSSTTTQTACNSYLWNATTYTASGIYTYTTQNAAGCDSIAQLNLTIRNSSSSISTHSACENYVWNNVTYTVTGVYTFTTQNAVGCDSIAYLNLAIRHNSSSATLTACDSYTWNATTYTTSGIYTYSTQNVAGCDSIATLDLTIYTSPITPTISAAGTQTFCPLNPLMISGPANMSAYLWSNGVTTRTVAIVANGSYALKITDVHGCSSPFSSSVLASNGVTSDFNNNGTVEVNDFLIFLPKFGASCNCQEDLNLDGTVNINDFLLFLPVFGTSCQ